MVALGRVKASPTWYPDPAVVTTTAVIAPLPFVVTANTAPDPVPPVTVTATALKSTVCPDPPEVIWRSKLKDATVPTSATMQFEVPLLAVLYVPAEHPTAKAAAVS
jgi:hypothetical protein